MGVFYADDGIILSRGPEWVQGVINVLIRLFRRFGLISNVEKSKTKTCQPGVICTGMSEEAFIFRIKGEGGTYWERLQWCIPCPYFGVDLMIISVMAYCRRLHGAEPEIDCNRLTFSQT